jgi:hypothetical protein
MSGGDDAEEGIEAGPNDNDTKSSAVVYSENGNDIERPLQLMATGGPAVRKGSFNSLVVVPCDENGAVVENREVARL